MDDVQYRAMTIYVESGVLKCSPYGRSKGFDLVYEGVGNPLEINTWQHISCMFSNQRFAKAQYLAIDMDLSGDG